MFHGLIRGYTCIESLASYLSNPELASFYFQGKRLVRKNAEKLIDRNGTRVLLLSLGKVIPVASKLVDGLRKYRLLKRIQKTMTYSRLRQYLPVPDFYYTDDRGEIDDAEIVAIHWPENIAKPRIGIIKDFEIYPRWTKYCRFFEKNNIPYGIYDIHAHDWIEKAHNYDLIIGIVANEPTYLNELRDKYFFLETYLGKKCYPSPAHILLYENKSLEAYVSQAYDIPFVKTYVSHSKEDALKLIEKIKYPFVSKVDPTSGSIGVELVKNPQRARAIIKQAFSHNGRKVYVQYFRQKNYVYFQEYVPNDGYDIRVILVGNWAFGYYRKVLPGDFRASGMNLIEERALPEEAIRIACDVNHHIKSPLLVVDMVHGLDGKYSIIEFSIVCLMEQPEELHVDGEPGVYIIEDDGSIHFEKGRYWVNELALREFLLKDYLPSISQDKLAMDTHIG
jgi:glutathione synthase/RimK-type ligase-like ATP-grasp enzyme